MRIEQRVFQPGAMGGAERERFAEWLYPAHCAAFSGVSLEAFRRYVVEPDALRTRIEVYADEHGAALGYTAVHIYERCVDGAPVLVGRVETGLAPELRASGISVLFIMDELLKARFEFPRLELYYLGCLVSPMSYVLFSRSAPESWPHPSLPTPAGRQRVMEQLAESFDLPQVDPARPLIRSIGWSARLAPDERARFARSRRAHVQYFLEQNPGFSQGDGMLFLMPMSWENVRVAAQSGSFRTSASRIQEMMVSLASARSGPGLAPVPAPDPAPVSAPLCAADA